uniref:Uncharacterized protein n=1 Tax=Knipowitschia caucasica TaxID=637954 RepID=A0AAV2JQK8_KNICA
MPPASPSPPAPAFCSFCSNGPEESGLTPPEDIMKEAGGGADRRASTASFNEASWSPELPFDNIMGKQNVSLPFCLPLCLTL